MIGQCTTDYNGLLVNGMTSSIEDLLTRFNSINRNFQDDYRNFSFLLNALEDPDTLQQIEVKMTYLDDAYFDLKDHSEIQVTDYY